MPIKYTNTRSKEVTSQYDGRVVEIRKYVASRNCSDTLDYSDWRDVNVTEALVYVGRVTPDEKWIGCKYYPEPGKELPLADRFQWVDCSNVFAWRNEEHSEPEVDVVLMPDIFIDYAEWKKLQAELAEVARVEKEMREKREAEQQAEIERNRPEVGKKMVVVKGRKVPVGTVGTVSFISRTSGKVLLKADNEWQDRKANGTWVDPGHLKAR